MRILISGSSGDIGSAVKALAMERGHEVFEVNRGDYAAGALDLPEAIDAVIFATGTCPIRPTALTSDELLAETVRVNCGLFLKLMRTIVAERRYSREGMTALAISSVSASEGWPGGAAYCASKGALSAMCRAMEAELAPKGISVRAPEPRYVKTKMFDAGAGRMGVSAAAAISPREYALSLLACVEQRRMKELR